MRKVTDTLHAINGALVGSTADENGPSVSLPYTFRLSGNRGAVLSSWGTEHLSTVAVSLGEMLRKPTLFRRFHRVDKARSRAAGGAGLALAIVKTLVEAHGGTISVESQLGQGSIFTCRFPNSASPASLR